MSVHRKQETLLAGGGSKLADRRRAYGAKMRTARHVVTLIYSVTCNGELDVLCTLRSVILEIDKKKERKEVKGVLERRGVGLGKFHTLCVVPLQHWSLLFRLLFTGFRPFPFLFAF